MQGRQRHSHQYTSGKETIEADGPTSYVSLKDPPSMHLRDDMAKRRVKTFDGYKVMECALTWAEFERKYGADSK
jgi:hypothetical protein